MIIMISGKQGSGKSTITSVLLRSLSNDGFFAEECRFAGAIYDMHNFCLSYIKQRGIQVPDKDGKLLQFLGTDWARKQYGENIWVDLLKTGILNDNHNDFYIISDCRFENEFDAFPEAFRVRLECPEEIRKNRAHGWRENTEHPSETGLDGYAADHMFDLYINTSVVPAEDCARVILSDYNAGNWRTRL